MTDAQQIARLEAHLARERLLTTVAIAANEAADPEEALEAAMRAVCAHTGWTAARADLTDPGAAAPRRVRHGELTPGSTRVLELPVCGRDGGQAARLEFYAEVPVAADEVLLDGVAQVGRQLERVVHRVHVEQALRRALADLERSNSELEAFAYAASHDLREPLRTLAGFAQLLARRYEGRLDDDADTFLQHIVEGAERLQQLVDDLLTLSRAGRPEARRDVVDLGAVAGRTLRELGAAIREAGATVEAGELPEVVGDGGQLGQVLANLVANGLKFHGDEPPHVVIAGQRRDGGWMVTVEDRGPGVRADQAEQIFELFHRAGAGGDTPGSGVGLAICRRIVEHHGGRIWVEPGAGGRGARFCVLLPDREPCATPLPSARTAAPHGGAVGAAAA